jgi:hypothetical protein
VKQLIILLSCLFFATHVALADESDAEPKVLSTGAQKTVLKGQVNYLVPQGTTIKLKLATVPTNGMHLADRDLDGKLFPAQVNQKITAKTTEDIYVDDNKVIPEGTIFEGHVSHIVPPKRLGRPGSIEIAFDALTTPDGRKFAFRAEADNIKESTFKSKSKGFGIIAAHAAGGAIVGALVAYQLTGLKETIALHGYNIAGGAAAGALLATGFAIMRRGPKAVLEPGDDLNMQTNTELLMPATVEPSLKKKDADNLPGLAVTIEQSKMMGDGLDGHLLRLDLVIDNNSPRRLNSIDLFVEDSNGNNHPVCSGAGDDDEFLFSVDPYSKKRMRLNFAIEFPKLKYQLVWLERNSRQICFREPIP